MEFKDLKVFDKITEENVDLLLEELTNLGKDNLLDIPRDAKVVSDMAVYNKISNFLTVKQDLEKIDLKNKNNEEIVKILIENGKNIFISIYLLNKENFDVLIDNGVIIKTDLPEFQYWGKIIKNPTSYFLKDNIMENVSNSLKEDR
ncbi:hypothetical protein HP397_06675 [Streptobacillus felis]|uniref:Uncharacterized protein n=1 Tax=Streptobacillus felis TaxID=1384509 RepID=A0A7Z0PFW4_9FUSO|nr:hypothetical protein [Streptobacillus felis]NYV28482.1 hypothetical protein [Streptobacillus felis]